MNLIRCTYSRTGRIICFLFALYILNFSIDPKDRQANYLPEDLTINEIESFTEFLVEVLLGFDNAFAEHDEADNENNGHLDFAKVVLTTNSNGRLIDNRFKKVRIKYFIRNTDAFATLAKAIDAPPPKA